MPSTVMALIPLLKMAPRALPVVILKGHGVQKAHQRTVTQPPHYHRPALVDAACHMWHQPLLLNGPPERGTCPAPLDSTTAACGSALPRRSLGSPAFNPGGPRGGPQ